VGTHLQDGTRRPKALCVSHYPLPAAFLIALGPKKSSTFKEDVQHPQWHTAMQEESMHLPKIKLGATTT